MGYLTKWRAAVSIRWLANWKELVGNLSRPNWRHYPGIFLGKTSGITVVLRVEGRVNLPIQARSSTGWDSLLNPNTTIDLFLDVDTLQLRAQVSALRTNVGIGPTAHWHIPHSAPENSKPHMLIYETGNVSVTHNWGAFAQPLLQWKRNMAFCVFYTLSNKRQYLRSKKYWK